MITKGNGNLLKDTMEILIIVNYLKKGWLDSLIQNKGKERKLKLLDHLFLQALIKINTR